MEYLSIFRGHTSNLAVALDLTQLKMYLLCNAERILQPIDGATTTLRVADVTLYPVCNPAEKAMEYLKSDMCIVIFCKPSSQLTI